MYIVPVISVGSNVAVSGKKVLIVDDSLHTGATVDVAAAYLIGSGAIEIKMASITYVANRKPDFFVLPKGNYSFPWSKDYSNTGD